MNFDELLQKAKRGEISQEEIDDVARVLTTARDENLSEYTLLHIIGRGFSLKHEELVVSFLERKDDPMLVRLALQILCHFWGKTEKYLATVKEYLHGAPWDEDDDVKLMAISITGEYLRKKPEADLLRRLLHLFRDAAEERITREAAYCAMARAYGWGWQEIPRASRHFDLEKDTDKEVLEWALARTSEGGEHE
ncbi:MAG: hypothetical protein AB1714_01025 [Acidobacteriota bacterium]